MQLRALCEAVCGTVLGVFFRRVEVVGLEHVPPGGVLFAANHPNGLLDPLCVMRYAPRPVSFLAKAPLFDTVIVKHFVRGLECLPVYRKADGFDTKRNAEVLREAAALLDAGGSIAIFPEGKTHDQPGLERLKTGPARIALGAKARGDGTPIHVVPAAIFYDDKRVFRSDAAVVFGPALAVADVALDEAGEPDREAVRVLTQNIRDGLEAHLVQAPSHQLLQRVALASRLVRGARRDLGEDASRPPLGDVDAGPIERERRLRLRILEGYTRYAQRSDAGVDEVVRRLEQLDARCRALGLDLATPAMPERRVPMLRLLASAVVFGLVAPLALLGVLLHYPTYRFNRIVATRMAEGAGELSGTMKLLGGFLFFPLTWLAVALGVGVAVGWGWGLLAAVLGPASGWVAMRWAEAWMIGWTLFRTAGLRITRADAVDAIVRERAEIYAAIMGLEDRLLRDANA
jgi:1-acyl-sn-glycerol-3-phosphate acyltransferase